MDSPIFEVVPLSGDVMELLEKWKGPVKTLITGPRRNEIAKLAGPNSTIHDLDENHLTLPNPNMFDLVILAIDARAILTPDIVNRFLSIFIKLTDPATTVAVVGDGVYRSTTKYRNNLLESYNKHANHIRKDSKFECNYVDIVVVVANSETGADHDGLFHQTGQKLQLARPRLDRKFAISRKRYSYFRDNTFAWRGPTLMTAIMHVALNHLQMAEFVHFMDKLLVNVCTNYSCNRELMEMLMTLPYPYQHALIDACKPHFASLMLCHVGRLTLKQYLICGAENGPSYGTKLAEIVKGKLGDNPIAAKFYNEIQYLMSQSRWAFLLECAFQPYSSLKNKYGDVARMLNNNGYSFTAEDVRSSFRYMPMNWTTIKEWWNDFNVDEVYVYGDVFFKQLLWLINNAQKYRF